MSLFGPPNIEKLFEKKDIKGLIKALGYDKDDNVRKAAVEALGKLGDTRAVEPLLESLNDESNNVRKSAIEALGKLREPKAVEPLIKLLHQKNESLKKSSIEALSNIKDPLGKEALIKLLAEKESNIRKSAAEALEKLGETKWAQWVKGNDDDYERLAVSGDQKANEILIENIRRKDKRIISATGKTGDIRAVDPLIELLDNSDSDIRLLASEALGKIGDTRAVMPLITLLTDKDDNVLKSTVEALGKLGDKRAVESLTKLLSDRRSEIRRLAVEAIGKLGDTHTTELLIKLMANNDKEIRKSAAESLGRIGDKRAVEPLIRRLTDSKNIVRGSAAEALGKLGDRRAVEPLIKLLDDRDNFVRLATVKALEKIADTRAFEPLINLLSDSDIDIRKSTVEALRQYNNIQAVKPLIKILVENDENTRKAAASILENLGEKKWSQWVKGDDNDFDRLSKSGDPEANELLINNINKKNNLIILALRNIKDTRVVEPLTKLLIDNEYLIRRSAAMTLENLGERKWSQWVKGDDDDFERLSKSGDSEANDLLINNIDKKNRLIILAIGNTKDKRVLEPLINLLSDGNSIIRKSAIEGLSILGDPQAVDTLIKLLLDNDKDIRKSAAIALGNLGENKWSQWVKGDDDDFERLSKSEDLTAIEILVNNLNRKDPKIILAARNTKDNRIISPLIKFLSDSEENVRDSAARVLKNLCYPQTIKPLIKLLASSYGNTRESVVNILIEISKKYPAYVIKEKVHNDYKTSHSDYHFGSGIDRDELDHDSFGRANDCIHNDTRSHEDSGGHHRDEKLIGFKVSEKYKDLDF